MALRISLTRYPELKSNANLEGTWSSLIKTAALNDKQLQLGLEDTETRVSVAENTITSIQGDITGILTTYKTDFLGSNSNQREFVGIAVSGGNVTFTNNGAGIKPAAHPGQMRIFAASVSNSGYKIGTYGSSLLLQGGESTNIIYTHDTISNSLFWFGFIDTSDKTESTDGCYFRVDGTGALTANMSNNSVRTSSALTTVSASVWYHYRVSIGSSANYASFQVFSSAGSVVASVALSTSVPSGSGRYTGSAVLALCSTASGPNLGVVDYLDFSYNSVIPRGDIDR